MMLARQAETLTENYDPAFASRVRALILSLPPLQTVRA
jgi:hypothetical protein